MDPLRRPLERATVTPVPGGQRLGEDRERHLGAGISAGTRRSSVGIMLEDGFAYRGGALQTARMAERAKDLSVRIPSALNWIRALTV